MRLPLVGRDSDAVAQAIRNEQPEFPAFISEIGAVILPLFVPPHQTRYRSLNVPIVAARMTADPQAPHTNAGARPADAVRARWVDDAPVKVQPYLRLMRLDRPIGAWLLYWPCVFGLALGASVQGETVPNVLHLVLTGIGALVMRGAGCTYNDIVDRDYDARVARTRNRPIPSGAVSVKQAWALALGLSLVGFVILLSFNLFA